MHQIGCLFFFMTFLAGLSVTGGSAVLALINVVIFVVIALAVARFIEPRFGQPGLVFGMGGAFFVSFLWPYLLIPFSSDPDCVGDDCLRDIFVTATPEKNQ